MTKLTYLVYGQEYETLADAETAANGNKSQIKPLYTDVPAHPIDLEEARRKEKLRKERKKAGL